MNSPDAYIALVKVKATMEREYYYSRDHNDWKRMLIVEEMMKIVEKAMEEEH